MKRTIFITGLGTFSGAGASNDAFRAALIEGGGTFSPLPEPLHRLAPGFGGMPVIDRKLLRRARHLHLGSYFLLDALRPELAALYTEAKALGLSTSLDTNWDPSGTWDGGLAAALAAV